MKLLDNIDKEDQEFLRRVVLAMIENGSIRLPEVDLASGTPEESAYKMQEVFRRILMITNSSLDELDNEMTLHREERMANLKKQQ